MHVLYDIHMADKNHFVTCSTATSAKFSDATNNMYIYILYEDIIRRDWMWSRNETNLVSYFFQCDSHFFNMILSFCILHLKKYESRQVRSRTRSKA